jgi:hypothetical protein
MLVLGFLLLVADGFVAAALIWETPTTHRALNAVIGRRSAYR